MVPAIVLWIIEFLHFSQQHSLKYPYPNFTNSTLEETLALRSIHDEIANGSVSSETILDSLEIIEQLDQKERIKIPDSMKLAYCAVAVDCTMKHLVDKLEFLKKSELVTDELREFKEEMEAALLDSNACGRLLEKATRNETLRLVMDYLKEALDEMGPPFLELLARTERERRRSKWKRRKRMLIKLG
ncbi:hypothetical protein GH714_035557 [Hevea brasiliensis]|uniref:Uncharacterized protein n=1 Tax=Hevea brasiliensis TaxID=3981 RepID=A0A6A6N6C7_HEVBR|nr:hypothetical protein GH714_035557 [Hevea brasiliensis]